MRPATNIPAAAEASAEGLISSEVMRRVEHDLDLEETRLEI